MPEPSRPRPRVLAAALGLFALLIGLLDYSAWAWHIQGAHGRGLTSYFFARQDMWVLDGTVAALAVMAWWASRLTPPRQVTRVRGDGQNILILIGILAGVLAARIGRDLVFHGYSPSRDELMVEMAGAYLADGHLGWAIPSEWLPWQRAIMPEFYSPYGADTHWTAIYLPIHAAIRALFVRLGDPSFASPVMLGIGLLALWQIVRRLLPDRPDAHAVTMVMALTSTQLVAMAMTPYAMSSHFALDMVWLALLLRGDKLGHGLAAIVALLAAGLHQWHFPLIFMAPFILWLFARRQWQAGLFHALVCVAMMVVWARFWPMILIHEVGTPPPSDIHRTNGILDKIESLFGRLDGWQPLLNNARLIAWNNLLLLPLAALSLAAIRLRDLFRDPPVILPLSLAVGIGMGLSLYQGYGWGFRYMHGQIGALCLLAGLGWAATVRSGDRKSWRLITASVLLSLVAAGWLLTDTQSYLRGYARSLAAIRASKADVVLVDIRGGFYMSDLVRFEDGKPGRPMIMALQMLRMKQLDSLCASKRVAIADRTLFWPAGVHRVAPVFRGSDYIEAQRAHLAAIGCGVPVTLTP